METLATLSYLVASVLFILGLKRLSKVRTARQGNMLAAVGMLLAMVTVLIAETDISWGWIIAGLVVGGGIGAVAAVKVQMTSMPEMVALFNGSGGIASALVALSFYFLQTKLVGDGVTLAEALAICKKNRKK